MVESFRMKGRRLALMAWAVAVCLVVLVVAWWSGWDLAYQIAALATGALLAPALVGGLGLWLGRSHQPLADTSSAGSASLSSP